MRFSHLLLSNVLYLSLLLTLLLGACGGSDGGTTPVPTTPPTVVPTEEPQVPVAVNDSTETPINSPVTIDVLSNDLFTGGISIDSLVQGSSGQASIEASSIIFTPLADFVGDVTFQYRLLQGALLSEWATVTVSVVDTVVSNRAPLAIDDVLTLGLNSLATAIDVLANDSDADGDAITISNVAQAGHGTVTIVDNKLLYKPDTNYLGADSFIYTIADGKGETAQASVDVSIVDTVSAIAINDFSNTTIGQSLEVNVMANDIHSDVTELRIVELQTAGSSGVFDIVSNEQAIHYTPDNTFSGLASCVYTVEDSNGVRSSAQLTVRVHTATTQIDELDVVNASDPDVVSAITNLAIDSGASVKNILSTASLGRSDTRNLTFHIKDAGDVDADAKDYLFSLSQSDEKLANIRLSDLLSEPNALSTRGTFLYIKDDTLQEQQVVIDIDWDNDGIQDLVLLREFGLQLYSGVEPKTSPVNLNVAGQYISAASSTAPLVMAAAATDINADGIDDLLVATTTASTGSGPRVRIIYGPVSQYTDNIFQMVLDATTGFDITGFDSELPVTQALHFAVGDLNGDDRPDVVIGGLSEQDDAGARTGQVYIIWGAQSNYTSFNIETFIAESLEAQGAVSGGSVSARTTPAGSLILWEGSEDEAIGAEIRVADLNNDGIDDLVLGNSMRTAVAGGRYLLAVSTLLGHENWQHAIELASVTSVGLAGQRLVANTLSINDEPLREVIVGLETGDINGDHYADIVLQTTGKAAVVLGGSASKPALIDAGGLESNWPVVTVALLDIQPPMACIDINRDGFDDLVLARHNNSILDAFVIYGGLQFNGNSGGG